MQCFLLRRVSDYI